MMIRSSISKTFIKLRRRRCKLLLCPVVLILCFLYYFLGASDYIFSRSFEKNFDYPLNINIRRVVAEVLSGNKTSVKPINYYPYRFLTNSGKCKTIEKLDLFIVVKSAMKNFGHREAIRQTYGQENHIPGRIIKTLFFLGIDGHSKSDVQRLIEKEMATYKDIIQIDFHDTYFNNTIKTMMAFRWLYEHCSTADYYLFTDDDMYISVSNLIDYVNNQPSNQIRIDLNLIDKYQVVSRTSAFNVDGNLYAGYVFKSSPQRFKISKWRVTLEEYPWDMWPPYVTAGAYVISNKSMKYLYVGSFFVKHFRFDDVYLGIVAKKVGIRLEHCPQFHFYSKKYSKDGYMDVIAAHGFHDHAKLIKVWTEQNTIVK